MDWVRDGLESNGSKEKLLAADSVDGDQPGMKFTRHLKSFTSTILEEVAKMKMDHRFNTI